MAPLTPDWVVPLGTVESKSDPESGEDVATPPCSFPVEPDKEAAGVGRFFLSLKQWPYRTPTQIDQLFKTIKIRHKIVLYSYRETFAIIRKTASVTIGTMPKFWHVKDFGRK